MGGFLHLSSPFTLCGIIAFKMGCTSCKQMRKAAKPQVMGEPEKTILLQSDMSMQKTKMSHEAELPEVEWREVEKEHSKKEGPEQSQAMAMNAAEGSVELISTFVEQPSILPMHGVSEFAGDSSFSAQKFQPIHSNCCTCGAAKLFHEWCL